MESETVSYTQFEVKELIRMVKNHPIIYDSSRADFKNPDKRDKLWSLIGTTISLSPAECQKRWRTLRERYTRELRRLKFYGEQSSWECFNEMSFLNQFIKCRTARKRQYDIPSIKDPLDDSYPPWNEVKQESYTPTSPISTNEQTPDATIASPKADDDDDGLFYVERLDNSILYQPPSTKSIKRSHNDHSYHEMATETVQSHCDEDGLFCESVAFSLRRLSRLNNIKAKVEIYKVLERLIEIEESNI